MPDVRSAVPQPRPTDDAPPGDAPPDGAPVDGALVARLRRAGCVDAEDEAALLLAAATGDRHLARLVGQRVAGLPLEQVLGWAEFCGLRIAVAPGVFVPRRRTALLVRQGAVHLGAGSVVVDACCGTGAVGAALLAAVPGLVLHACDVDPRAVACARTNLAGRAQVHQGDLLAALPEALRGTVELVAVSPPYVPSGAVALLPPEARLHEPLVALDGGADGLQVARRLVAGVGPWLAPGGRVLVECSEQQAQGLRALVTAAGLRARVVRDEDADATLVEGVRPAARTPSKP